MDTIDVLPRTGIPDFWGYCPHCGHTLLVEDAYCPSCGKQRDYGEYLN